MLPALARTSSFARYAWGVLACNLGVVVWGAFVRASGSGAGCGAHWPACNGEIVPRSPRFETIVEFGHRVTSGVALLLVVGMALWARRTDHGGEARNRLVRRASLASVGFMLAEALLGAALVLFELVAHDASLKRGFSVALHLGNTFVLLACIALTALWSSGLGLPRREGRGPVVALLAPALVGALLLGTSGAIAALGDTLFPARSLAEGLAQDWSATAHVFIKLRAFHPFLAVAVGVYVVIMASALRVLRPTPAVAIAARVLTLLFLAQVGLGLLNVALLAPIGIQLAHLLMADFVWLTLVTMACASLAAPSASEVALTPAGGPMLRA